jgi:hypothetical protein
LYVSQLLASQTHRAAEQTFPIKHLHNLDLSMSTTEMLDKSAYGVDSIVHKRIMSGERRPFITDS